MTRFIVVLILARVAVSWGLRTLTNARLATCTCAHLLREPLRMLPPDVVHMDISEGLKYASSMLEARREGISLLEADLPYLFDIDMKYSFMFPTAIAVSSLCITAGIGGAALFAPILLIVFPLLGPEYPLQSASASVATAILVETFGFSSGCVGYFRRNLIDPELSLQFALLSVPVAVASAANLHLDAVTLKQVYSVLMIALSFYFFAGGGGDAALTKEVSISDDAIDCDAEDDRQECKIWVDAAGLEYSYAGENIVGPLGGLATVVGSALTGVLGVGIGEVVLPQLLRQGVPLSIAAASSTLTVTLTALTAATVQLSQLVKDGGLSSVPWNLIQFMIPGVLVGGQIASRAQGRLSQAAVEKAIAILFALIGGSFAALTLLQSSR